MSHKIYIYGAGKYGVNCYEFLVGKGFDVDAFLVSDKTNNPESIKDCPVFEYDSKKLDVNDDWIFVALKKDFCEEVLPVLKNDGFKHIQLFPCLKQDDKFNNSNKKILIFGTGKYTLNNCLFFYENEIVGYLDNNPLKRGGVFDGKKIFAAEDVNAIDFDYVCVLSLRYAVEMAVQLMELGVPKEKIISPIAFRKEYYRICCVRNQPCKTLDGLYPVIPDFLNYKKYDAINFPKQERPLVSIIVPVYNQFSYTYNCLLSIHEHTTDDVPYEVIVADDCSTDQTVNVEKIVVGATVIHNKENLRFLKNCNNAAKSARGKYILFLNNDTQVQQNWLESLFDLMEKDESIGLAGSKLIYPDGVLQEAGGILWKDASAWNYGNGGDPSMPEFNYVKEADYISGASIMIRADLWTEIGGFDERFCPAYCEDSDFAFEVRKRGYKVMYQPASVVVHYEGRSNGTDLSSGQKKYQVVNNKKFYEKWKGTLSAEHFENGVDVFCARDRSRGKKTILIIDDCVPAFDLHAGGKTTFQYMKMFVSHGYSVKFVADDFCMQEPYSTKIQQLGVEFLGGPWYAENFWSWLENNHGYIDIVYLNRPHVSVKYIDRLQTYKGLKIIYYGHDLHSLRMLRSYEISGNYNELMEAYLSKEMEYSIMKKTAMNYFPSSEEIKVIHQVDASIPVKAITAYVYDKFLQSINYNFESRDGIVFVGSRHTPNVDALFWFVNEIYPLVTKKIKIPFYVVGATLPDDVRRLEGNGVVIKGYLSDDELTKLYQSSKMSVVPLRYGAGVKGKVVEALYNGVPIVTTSVGAEGIPDIADAVKIEDSAEAFAEAVIRLYNDNGSLTEMAKKSQDVVRKNFSKDAVWSIIKDDFE